MSIDKKSSYYDVGGIETIDIMKAKLTPEQYVGYLLGNIIKYSSRANHKGSFHRDMEKVAVYSKELSDYGKCSSETEDNVADPYAIVKKFEDRNIDLERELRELHESKYAEIYAITLERSDLKDHAEELAKECATLGSENVRLELEVTRLQCELQERVV